MFVKKKALESALSKLRPHPKPKVALEQYTTPASLASSILHTATYTHGDIAGKTVCDLGCGTGILAIGALLLGAELTVAVDVDAEAVEVGGENSDLVGVRVDWVIGDINALKGPFHTALQNPPFGVKRRGMDVAFLKKALNIAGVVYSIHKTGVRNTAYIRRVVRANGGDVDSIFRGKLIIPHQFNFHTKRKVAVDIDVYRIISSRRLKLWESRNQANS
ncbi:MAG: METTL5 family protein [Candidatus Bathyarchaeia archaeon]